MMRKYLSTISILLLVLFSSGSGITLLIMKSPEGSKISSISAPVSYEIANSTNPSFPTTLNPNNGISECYSLSGTNYYYQTGLTSSYYSIIYIRPQSAEDTYDLYLYETDYVNLLTASMRGSGKMNWVVIKGSSYYYPKVYVHSGSEGYANMDRVTCPTPSSNIYIDQTYSEWIGGDDFLIAYTLILYNDSAYDIELTVSNGDVDLYLYYINDVGALNATEYEVCSATPGIAVAEKITKFKPQYSGYHVAVLVRGSDISHFSIQFHYYRAPFDFFGILIPAFIVISVLGVALLLGRKYSHTKNAN